MNCLKARFLLVIAFSNKKKRGEENYVTYVLRCLQAEYFSQALPAKLRRRFIKNLEKAI